MKTARLHLFFSTLLPALLQKPFFGLDKLAVSTCRQGFRHFLKIVLSLFAVASLLFFAAGCVRFKIDELKPSLITKLKIGDELGTVEAKVSNNALVNIPFRIPINLNRVYISDYESSLIKVYGSDGDLDFILGNIANKSLKIKVVQQKFTKPGLIAVSSDDDLFVQNRITIDTQTVPPVQEVTYSKNSGYFNIKEQENIPSFILQINNKGKVIAVIGISGKNSEPFRYIESMYAYDKNRFFVYHEYAEQMHLNYYLNGELAGSISEGNLNVFSGEESKDYRIKLDTMIPHKEGDFALLSFSFIGKKDNRFKFRRIYRFKFNEKNPDAMLKEYQSPSEILFAVRNNKEFYIWETENKGESVKLKVHDKDGNHVNNKRLQFPPPRSGWRETYMDETETIYSIRVRSGYLELYSWN